MSCTNCNKSNCTCSDNCPNKASDITVFDCPLNVIEIPCDASLCDVIQLLEAYTTNMVNELSDMTSAVVSGDNCFGLPAGTYSLQQIVDAISNLNCPSGILAKSATNSVSAIVPGMSTDWTDGTIQILNEIYDDSNSYDDSTGIWTCPTTGRYDISFYVHMTRNIGTGWFNAEDGSMIRAGIVHPNLNSIYVGSTFSATTIQRYADMTGCINGVYLTAGAQLCLKVINESGFNYTSGVTDVSYLSIQKTK